MKPNVARPDPLKSSETMVNDSEIDSLKTELENEKSHRNNAQWRNNDMEKAIVRLQELLRKDDYEWEYDEELLSTIDKNQDMSDEIQKLKEELPELKERLKSAKVCGKECRMKHDNLNINLDLLSEVELLKTIKRLERMKIDLKSALISKEWNLDSESKVYQRILDQKLHLQNQLYYSNMTMANKDSSLDRWHNGGIAKPFRTFDLKNGPIKKTVALEKLPPAKKQ